MNPLTRDKFLSPEEQEHLEKNVASANPDRDQLLIQLAMATGARAQEILNVNIKDLAESDTSVYIRGLKGSRDREIPLPKALFIALKSLESEGRLFPISYQRLHQIWQNYRPNGKKFHALRHTFAINLYRRTKDVRLVQLALGHKDLRNTMVYVDFQYSIDELRKHLGK